MHSRATRRSRNIGNNNEIGTSGALEVQTRSNDLPYMRHLLSLFSNMFGRGKRLEVLLCVLYACETVGIGEMVQGDQPAYPAPTGM